MTLDFVCLDEPVEIDETIFKQLMNRISGGHTKNQFILLTTNPASQSHWIYEYFFIKPTEEYYTVETTTYDNVLLPNYKKYITNLEDNLDDDWIRRFLNGRWGAYSGQIYKEFDLEKHIGDYKEFKDFDFIIAGVDWGIKNPSCIISVGITKEKEAIVIDEFYESGKTSVQIAEKIATLHKHHHYKKVYCDPSALDLITQTKDLKVPIDKADNDVSGGIGKVKSLLKTYKLHVDKSCKNLIRELQSYRYERDKMNHNPTEKPVKEDDHSCDALRYAFTNYRAFRETPVLGFVKRALWDF
jgi:PBSX family phage terminase large subunit